MSQYYEKYLKGKTTSLLVKTDTKEELTKLRYELQLKSMDDLLRYLIDQQKTK